MGEAYLFHFRHQLERLDWRIKAGNDRSVNRSVANWNHRLEVMGGARCDLPPFGHCGLEIKYGLTKLRVGTWTPSAESGNEVRLHPKVFMGGRKAAIGRRRAGEGPDDGDSGIAAAASSFSPNDLSDTPISAWPLRDENWRIFVAALLTEADIYINLRRRLGNEKYSGASERKISRAGFELVRAAGGMEEAERQLRLT